MSLFELTMAALPVSPVIATAIHAGHELRAEIAALIALDEANRLREEDPYTDDMIADFDTRLVVRRSRFEVDCNRMRDAAVYRRPADAWGLEVWREELPPDVVSRSAEQHDEVYGALGRMLDETVAAHGVAVVLDVHSYNHRRDGSDAPVADPATNPEVNLGTGSVDRSRWGDVADRFTAHMRGLGFDCRENVKFQGGHLARWVHEHYPDTACALAVEFKKTFMDEWTGRIDGSALARIRSALAAFVPVAERTLHGVSR
jgi:N-formylglutamate amidohydrolase